MAAVLVTGGHSPLAQAIGAALRQARLALDTPGGR
jgi:hypothetical protein